MLKNKNVLSHFFAVITVIIWGTTFISTKMLLKDFRPIEIIFFRLLIGFLALSLAYPRRLKVVDGKQECLFALAGLCGVTLYHIFENVALTYSFASNVSVIVATAPLFIALLAQLLLIDEKVKPRFFIGFVAAIAGIALISFNGSMVLKLNPLGDILALLAAITWAVYSIVLKKISAFQYNIILVTRRIFFYGLLFMIPALFLFQFELGLGRFTQPSNLIHILFLGLGASALCFVTWNFALKTLGAVKTSVYIYMVPVITVVMSAIVLRERITGLALLGTMLTLTGLFISENVRSEEPASGSEHTKGSNKHAAKKI